MNSDTSESCYLVSESHKRVLGELHLGLGLTLL